MTHDWATLPSAVVGLILSHVTQEAAAHHNLVRYATVNKDWQYLFEQLTFRSMNLGPDDLAKFETIVAIHRQRRKWVREVTFHDRADVGAHLDGGSANHAPETKLSEAFWSLLTLLEKWNWDAKLRLTLSFSAPTATATGLDKRRKTTYPCPSPLIWEVPAIKSMSVQYSERIVTTSTVMNLCSKMPELEELYLQDLDHKNDHNKHFKIAELIRYFPTTLRRLHVLGHGGRDPAGVCPFLVQRLIWFGITAPLRDLSITTSGDAAEEFFEYPKSPRFGSPSGGTYYCTTLQSLTLACSQLRPGTPHASVNRIIHQAGMAALGLPRLRELWLLSYSTRNPGGVDGFFHYVSGGQGRDTATCFGESVRWHSKVCLMLLTYSVASEHIRIGRLVKDVWENVAWQSNRVELRFSSKAHVQSPRALLTAEELFGEHEGSAFENLQYPRPHWTASEKIRNFLGDVVFFVALVSFLSWLVAHWHVPPNSNLERTA